MRYLVILMLVLGVTSSCFAADFHPVFVNTILPHEGGFSNDRQDPGNWTGGKVGKGKFMGTKYGIAANTYGLALAKQGRTIKSLTVAEAEAIYKRDYWDAYRLGDLKSQGIADEICDEIVNGGPGLGRNLLFKVYDELRWAGYSPPVAAFNKENIDWINNFTGRRDRRIAFYNSIRIKRVRFYVNLAKKNPSMRKYILSWADRSTD